MRRINLRDVPDDVYDALVEAAATNRQSLNAFVVDQLSDVARTARLREYLLSYDSLRTGLTLEDAMAAVREVREST